MFILAAILFCSHLYSQNQDYYEPMVAEHPFTKVSFDFEQINFGTVTEGEQVKVVYTIYNTGNEPLIIYDAYGSCGCTIPEWSKDPIKPGKSGKITAVFDSKGRPGENMKKITIKANTEPIHTYLLLQGMVEANKKQDNLPRIERAKKLIPDDLIELFPNPAADVLSIIYKETDARKYKIYNVEGRELLSGTISGQTETLDVSRLNNGIYTFQLQYNGDSYVRQFIVQR